LDQNRRLAPAESFMDRTIVYPGSIPLDADLLSTNRNAMLALGYLAQAVLGQNTIADGLACNPTSPASLGVTVGAGSLTQLTIVDTLSYGSLPADTSDMLVKMGINISSTSFTLVSPTSSGQSANYLIEASFLESDVNPVVLPYYNAANPAQPYSGSANSGVAQNTARIQRVQLQLKAGAPALTGQQQTPAVDAGWVGLYTIGVNYGQTEVLASNIVVSPTAPFLAWKLPQLRPGFASGVESFASSGNYVVPAGVTQVEVELWGGGSGSFASISGIPSGGGAGGGYARMRIPSLAGGLVVPISVGFGGNGGTTAGVGATAGGASSFGTYVSATGGSLNTLASIANPVNGATPGGVGVAGDVNIRGSSGQAGMSNQGGLGGAAPMGGTQNSGTTGAIGNFPGGGASGAGTGANSATPYNGAPGASGFVVVRW
jgi:hypothetical protein